VAELILGLDKLQKKLDKLSDPGEAIAKGMRNYALDIAKDVTAYPPESAANRPGRARWYVRGMGTQTATGKRYLTSEKMSNKWERKDDGFHVKRFGSSVRLEIINNASYAQYVIGDKQVRFHALRGWTKTSRLIEVTMGQAVRTIGKEIDKELSK
jgi:hypothetical protein